MSLFSFVSCQVNSRVPELWVILTPRVSEPELVITSLTWEIFALNISLSLLFYTLLSLWLHTHVHWCESKSQGLFFFKVIFFQRNTNIATFWNRLRDIWKLNAHWLLNALLKIRVKILVNFSGLVNLTIGSGFMHMSYHLWQT